nr:unnamed protein product [Callosobruchus chinensis]
MASIIGLALNTALLTIVIAQDIQFHIDRKFPGRYCGSKLARVLAEFCLSFYSPTSGKFSKSDKGITENEVNIIAAKRHSRKQRVKRQITTECCYNECSLDYLLESYCASVDTERLNRIEYNGLQETRRSSAAPQVQKPRTAIKGPKRARNKRNCLCKRRKRKKVNK